MIEINNLTKVFGDVVAVDNISFQVKQGEVLGFLGPNGAGKSTTMKMIAAYYEPSAGQIKVGALDVVKDSLKARRLIGYLPETVPLYDDMKVYEYLRFVAEIRNIAPDKVLSRLKEVVEQCGLEKVIGRNIDELSKGYRQRVGLAQAIVHNPEILILDEPTSGLDPNQIVEIRELIRQIGRAKTVLLSTHILAEAEATCDRLVIINKGKLVAQGKVADLMAERQGPQILNLQIKGDNQAIAKALALIPGLTISDLRVTEAGLTLCRLESTDDKREAVAQVLLEGGWPILEFTRSGTSLEDVFRDLTT